MGGWGLLTVNCRLIDGLRGNKYPAIQLGKIPGASELPTAAKTTSQKMPVSKPSAEKVTTSTGRYLLVATVLPWHLLVVSICPDYARRAHARSQ